MSYDWMRIKNDVNGNPRYVCHWMALERDDEREDLRRTLTLSERYSRAIARAKKLGGRKFHNKQYGGGIVFQCYGPADIEPHIERLLREAR